MWCEVAGAARRAPSPVPAPFSAPERRFGRCCRPTRQTLHAKTLHGLSVAPLLVQTTQASVRHSIQRFAHSHATQQQSGRKSTCLADNVCAELHRASDVFAARARHVDALMPPTASPDGAAWRLAPKGSKGPHGSHEVVLSVHAPCGASSIDVFNV